MQTLVHISFSLVSGCQRTAVLPGPAPAQQVQQQPHRLASRCQATATPSTPSTRTASKPPGRQAFTAADVATKSLQHSNWEGRYGVVLAPPSRVWSLPQVCDGNAVVMVEGVNDAHVVRRAVNAPVLIAGGTNSAKSSGGFARIMQVSQAVPTIVVLADPDAEGTRFRNWVVQNVGGKGLLHAFLPVSRAVLCTKTKYHQLGNPGVEHAYAKDVAKAVSFASAQTPGRSEFSREDLEEWEMLNGWDGAEVQHAALRREILCNALGVGKMDGGKLVKVLNTYGFPHEQVHRAVDFSRGRMSKVLPILLALKGMRRVGDQAALVDEMARPSVDTFVYALQKKVALACSQDIIQKSPETSFSDEASEYVCAFLQESGWTITPEFRDAVSQLFDSSRSPAQ